MQTRTLYSRCCGGVAGRAAALNLHVAARARALDKHNLLSCLCARRAGENLRYCARNYREKRNIRIARAREIFRDRVEKRGLACLRRGQFVLETWEI